MRLHQNEFKIVLIADDVLEAVENMTIYNRNLDKPNRYYVKQLYDAISMLSYSVILYDSPAQFLKNIYLHKDDLIFPYWFGQNSRSRHSLIPAICEAENIKYLGGDAFTKIICNDKNLSKLLCKQANLETPSFCMWSSPRDNYLLDTLDFPCVVKPNFEGTSLGIDDDNLVGNAIDASGMADKLYKEFSQPIIVEEFVSGKEVSICLVGTHGRVKAWAAAERFVEGNEQYFINKLYTFTDKKSANYPFALRSVKPEITDIVFDKCQEIFRYLDKVEFMRIDGRLFNDQFSVLELTPETHLGNDAEFCGTFIANGNFTYHEVIKLLIENCLEGYQNQSANR